MNVNIPTFDEFMNPLITAMHELGGSGTIDEINSKTVEIFGLNEQQLEVLHNPEKDTRTEVEYRLAWTRTYLKKYGVLENSSRGVWALTPEARDIKSVNPDEVKKYGRQQTNSQNNEITLEESVEEEINTEESWRGRLLEALLELDPSAFERLTQRLLREAGFIQVEVLGKTGDGGIDGKGLMRLGGLLSFHVLFQCKRYRGTVGAHEMRDFRGALVGRADKGLFITTGNFTQGAKDEATRDGAPAIDLIDGDQLIDKLKELNLGVKTELVEKITINIDWFKNL